MKAILLAIMLVANAEAPVRWLPVVFEKAAWLTGEQPTLATDLGRFAWDGTRWQTISRTTDPLVPMHRVRASAFLDSELTLSAHSAAAQLVDYGQRIIVMRHAVGRPISVQLPETGGLRASSLRLVAELEDAWFVQGIGVAGDAKLGLYFLRLARDSAGAAQVRGLGDAGMPAFSGSLKLANALWFLPDSSSENQDAWVLEEGRWRRESPPTPMSVLLDAQEYNGALWLAYSDGIAVLKNAERAWYPLHVELTEPEWLCEGPAGIAMVRGRWVRGKQLVGWSVGESEPDNDFPLDGQSCAFYTKASASQGLAKPLSVKISLSGTAENR